MIKKDGHELFLSLSLSLPSLLLFLSTVNSREKKAPPPDGGGDSRVSVSFAAAARDQPEIRYSMRKLEGDDFARWKSFSH